MYLEKIFELIRKEDVVLWIGSGFSLYAGYPNGQKLSESLYESLSVTEKNEIPAGLPLMELAEQYVRIKSGSRNTLNSLLRKEFAKPPLSTKWHEFLAKIPHIKTVITTNYDRLFELSYKEEIQPIIWPTDVAYRDQKTELFKVHGDINHPDSIVITRTDYTRLFQRHTLENLIWTSIKERLSNKAVVFIGYDLEDENIKVILQEVTDALGANRKEMFLIAPNFKQHKIHYLSQLGIQYLDFKGEVFVEKLFSNIKDRITNDFANGDVSVETLRKFFLKNNLQVDLKAVGNRFSISSINSLSPDVKSQVEMKFKSDKQFLESFHALVEGKRFGELQLDATHLEKLKLVLNDINVVDDNINNYQVLLKSAPQKEGKASIVFEDGCEFENILYQIYHSKKLFEIKATFQNCEFVYRMALSNGPLDEQSDIVTLNYHQKGNFESVNDAIKAYKLCLCIAKSLGFTIYTDDNSEGIYLKPEKVDFPITKIESNLDYFESLKRVEQLYHVRFSNLGDYSEDDFDNVYKAIQFANGGDYIQHWDQELSWDLANGIPLELLLKIEQGAQFEVESQIPEEIMIYGQKIRLGFQIASPLDLYITNLDQVMKQETTRVLVKSKSKKVRIYFAKSIRNEEGKNLDH